MLSKNGKCENERKKKFRRHEIASKKIRKLEEIKLGGKK